MSVLPPAGSHGGDGRRVAAALGLDPGSVLDLSASLNPLMGTSWRKVLAAHLDSLSGYPDPSEATGRLADAIGVATERLLLTNGGAEAISLLAAELGGHTREPDFSLYPRQAEGVGPRWRSNPHNPTGVLAGPTETAGVWDEAFYPLATGTWTRGHAAGSVVVGSLTKLFACPGLRIGYLLADPDLVERAARRQPVWAVNSLALAALPDLLYGVNLTWWARAVAGLRRELTDLLGTYGLEPQPSAANFVLCANAPGLRDALAPQGVVVRDCASFGLPGQARVAVPDAEGLERLGGALARAFG